MRSRRRPAPLALAVLLALESAAHASVGEPLTEEGYRRRLPALHERINVFERRLTGLEDKLKAARDALERSAEGKGLDGLPEGREPDAMAKELALLPLDWEPLAEEGRVLLAGAPEERSFPGEPTTAQYLRERLEFRERDLVEVGKSFESALARVVPALAESLAKLRGAARVLIAELEIPNQPGAPKWGDLAAGTLRDWQRADERRQAWDPLLAAGGKEAVEEERRRGAEVIELLAALRDHGVDPQKWPQGLRAMLASEDGVDQLGRMLLEQKAKGFEAMKETLGAVDKVGGALVEFQAAKGADPKLLTAKLQDLFDRNPRLGEALRSTQLGDLERLGTTLSDEKLRLQGKKRVSADVPDLTKKDSGGPGPSLEELSRTEAVLMGARLWPLDAWSRERLAEVRREKKLLEAAGAWSEHLKANEAQLQKEYEARYDKAYEDAKKQFPQGPQKVWSDAAVERVMHAYPGSLRNQIEKAMSLPSEERSAALLALQPRMRGLLDGGETGRAELEASTRVAELQKRATELQLKLGLTLAARDDFPKLQKLLQKAETDPGSMSDEEKAELEALQKELEKLPAYQEYQKEAGPIQTELQQRFKSLEELARKDPTYFAARGGWAKYVQHNRDRLGDFADGTSFRPEELGLPSEKVPYGKVEKATARGLPGFQFETKEGLLHFETADGSLTRDELRVKGQSIFIENQFKDGAMIARTLDGKGEALAATVYEPQPDGKFASHPEGSGFPKSLGRFENGQFVAERVEFEDGAWQERAGPELPGVWIRKDARGIDQSWTVEGSAIESIKDPDERARAIDRIAGWAVHRKFSGMREDDPLVVYDTKSIATALKDMFRGADPNTRREIEFDANDWKMIIKEHYQGGLRVTIGKFEATGTGWTDGANPGQGMGLSLYTCSGATITDCFPPDGQKPKSQFVKGIQYLGDWGIETFGAKIESNTDRWYWWITGAETTETPVVRRQYRTADGQYVDAQVARPDLWDKPHVVEKEVQVLYSGKGILGQTGDALATVGKGTVDLIGAGVAVSLAHNPLYLGIAKLTGSDPDIAYRDMMERAKTNFFNNAVSTKLGEIYGGDWYKEGKQALGLDTSKYIQNVGDEVRSYGPGYDTLAGVLQGGVNFANSTVPMMVQLQGLQVVSQLGNVGKLTAVGVGGYMSWEAGWGFGTQGRELVGAMSAYDPKDAASRDRYYAAVTGMTEQGLGMTLQFAGLAEVYGKMGKPGQSTAGLPKLETAPAEPTSGWGKLFAKVKALDAKIPDAIKKLPGGEWLNREGLGIRPGAGDDKIETKLKDEASKPKESDGKSRGTTEGEVEHLDAGVLMKAQKALERGDPLAVEALKRQLAEMKAQGKDVRVTPQMLVEMTKGSRPAENRAFVEEFIKEGLITIDTPPQNLSRAQLKEIAELSKILEKYDVGSKPGRDGITGGDADLVAGLMVRAGKGKGSALHTTDAKVANRIDQLRDSAKFRQALKEAGLEGYVLPEMKRWTPSGQKAAKSNASGADDEVILVGDHYEANKVAASKERKGSPGKETLEEVRSSDQVVEKEFDRYNAKRLRDRDIYQEDPGSKLEAKKAYQEAADIGRGDVKTPVDVEALNAAVEKGTLAPGVKEIDFQNANDCTIHALANQMTSAGKPVTVEGVYKIIEARFGKGLVEKIQSGGMSATEAFSVYKAVAEAQGVGLKTVPPEKLLQTIAETGKGAVVAVETGSGRHQVYVEGVVYKDGKAHVSMLDSNAGGRTFLPVESFAKIVRTGGSIVDPLGKPNPAWKGELEAFKQELKFKDTPGYEQALARTVAEQRYRRIVEDADYRAEVLRDFQKSNPGATEAQLVEAAKSLLAESRGKVRGAGTDGLTEADHATLLEIKEAAPPKDYLEKYTLALRIKNKIIESGSLKEGDLVHGTSLKAVRQILESGRMEPRPGEYGDAVYVEPIDGASLRDGQVTALTGYGVGAAHKGGSTPVLLRIKGVKAEPQTAGISTIWKDVPLENIEMFNPSTGRWVSLAELRQAMRARQGS